MGIEDKIALLISEAMILHMRATGVVFTPATCLDDLDVGRTAFALALIALAEKFDADAVRAHRVH